MLSNSTNLQWVFDDENPEPSIQEPNQGPIHFPFQGVDAF